MNNLIDRIKGGSQSAFAEVAERYEPLIESMVAKYSASGIEADDLRQEALTALFVAAVSYKCHDEVSFGLYAKVCIRNRIVSALRKNAGRRDGVQDDGSDVPSEESNPEREYIDRESYENLLEVIDEALTPSARSVFYLYLRDKSYREIADILKKDEKSVGNAIYRIKSKLKKRI